MEKINKNATKKELENVIDPATSFSDILFKLADHDYVFALLPYFAENIASCETSAVCELRHSALCTLNAQLNRYREKHIIEKLLAKIALKKGKMIMETSSKTEMAKLLKPPPPYYDGNRFCQNSYLIPEEELLAWCEASKDVPLLYMGKERAFELFDQVFPESNLFR